jgi:hypothetical protein
LRVGARNSARQLHDVLDVDVEWSEVGGRQKSTHFPTSD